MKEFSCIQRVVVGILILYGIAVPVNGVPWIGPPYNVAILHGQTGTITCNGSIGLPLHWRSRSPTDEGLGNGNSDVRPGYNISEFPTGNYHMQFTGNVSSTPTIISCSEPVSGIERKVYVIVFRSPVCHETSTADVNNITCFAEFRGDMQWLPYFECELIDGTQRTIGSNGLITINRDTGVQIVTAIYSLPNDVRNTTKVCSVKFNKSDEDVEGTATNTPELLWNMTLAGQSEHGVDDPKSEAGDIPWWGIALIVACFVGIIIVVAIALWKVKVYCSRYRQHRQVPAQII